MALSLVNPEAGTHATGYVKNAANPTDDLPATNLNPSRRHLTVKSATNDEERLMVAYRRL